MEKYNPEVIEPKWQKIWSEAKSNQAIDLDSKPKQYVLDMFPYPSGAGLHVGHVEGYTATDIYSRYLRMNGFNVLHPMGWDAFGLPAENYAIKTGTKPQVTTAENIKIFKKQLNSLGFSYDWDREINTTDPEYYKWTQWIFIKLLEKGLAYESTAPINFCPSCKTGLANEEVENGLCERCQTPVERRNIRQWILKITEYADRLLEDLDNLNWPEPIKEMQRNWIGKSEGASIRFEVIANEVKQSIINKITASPKEAPRNDYIEVFTTRPDTIFGATYMVVAPEHDFVTKYKSQIINQKEVDEYIHKSLNKSDIERTDLSKEKTGIEIKGVKAMNPVNNKEIPIFVADYVLSHYGTGAIMAVPAHDERDFEFAKKYNLPVEQVISQNNIDNDLKLNKAFVGDGININSDFLNGLCTVEAKNKATKWLEDNHLGNKTISYKLRDWIFSRQRYWGEPIPVVHCEKCGIVAVPEKDLPVRLPNVDKYEPSGTGDSPLVNVPEWVNTKCPKCAGPGKRETNTMPQWAGSCWYYLRFCDPHNNQELASKERSNYWLGENSDDRLTPRSSKSEGGVDMYVGGAEHAVLHLLYARFWHKFLYDIQVVNTKEPFNSLRNQGMILAEDGRKMSKSFGNIISPDEVIKKYGADTLRMFEMFLGPFETVKRWDTKSIEGIYRFLNKVYRLHDNKFSEENKNTSLIHKSIKKVSEDIQNFRFNTAISSLMILLNGFNTNGLSKKEAEIFLILLSPFAPHLSEEVWYKFGHKTSIFDEQWPKHMAEHIQDKEIEFVVQINSKIKAKIIVPFDLSQDQIIELIKTSKNTEGLLTNNIKKTIFIKNRLINFVV